MKNKHFWTSTEEFDIKCSCCLAKVPAGQYMISHRNVFGGYAYTHLCMACSEELVMHYLKLNPDKNGEYLDNKLLECILAQNIDE